MGPRPSHSRPMPRAGPGRKSMTQSGQAKKEDETQQEKEGEIGYVVTQLKKKAKTIMTLHDIKCK